MRILQLVVLAVTVAFAALGGEIIWGDSIIWGN